MPETDTDSVRCIPSSEQCSPIWLPDFVGDNLMTATGTSWDYTVGFFHNASIKSSPSSEKKSSRFRLNHRGDTNEQLPPARLCGLNRLN